MLIRVVIAAWLGTQEVSSAKCKDLLAAVMGGTDNKCPAGSKWKTGVDGNFDGTGFADCCKPDSCAKHQPSSSSASATSATPFVVANCDAGQNLKANQGSQACNAWQCTAAECCETPKCSTFGSTKCPSGSTYLGDAQACGTTKGGNVCDAKGCCKANSCETTGDSGGSSTAAFSASDCDAGQNLKANQDKLTCTAWSCPKTTCCETIKCSSWTGTCPTGTTKLSGSTTCGTTKGGNTCDKTTCCKANSCKTHQGSSGSFTVTSCTAGMKLKTFTATSPTCSKYKCTSTECCTSTDGASCSDKSKGAMTAGFCGSGKMYDSTKSGNQCAAASGGACDGSTAGDVHACCKDTSGQTCEKGAFATTKGKCKAGYSYHAKTDKSKNCKTSTCDTSDDDDLNTCCTVNTGALCSTVKDTFGWCPSGQSYDKTKASKKCKGTTCDSTDADDQVACCSANTGAKCSEAVATTDGWCPGGETYDLTKASNKCKATTASGGCVSTDKDDQKACCKTTAGAEDCKTGFSAPGKCSSNFPGLMYNEDNAAKKCVGKTCSTKKKDDTNTCCMEMTGKTCKDSSVGAGWCSGGDHPGMSYDEKNKKDNKCKSEDGCDKKDDDDVFTCCAATTGLTCGDETSVFFTKKGQCGQGKTYDEEKADMKCVSDPCEKSNKDDVNTCCKATTGATCSTITEATFCGIGMSIPAENNDLKCVGEACAADNADDIATCCAKNTGASCETTTEVDNFCGAGKSFDTDASGTNKCLKSPCQVGNKVDVLACCTANTGAKCGTVTAAAATNFCGKGKVFDTSGSANKQCTGTPCESGKAEDVAVCCKTAPATTTKKKKTTKKNNTSSIGATSSAQTNFVSASAVLLLFQLIA